MKKQNTITLFDMDGTLTPPRKKITGDVIDALKELSVFSRIGIISGSDFDYIIQQCGEMFDIGGVAINDVDILPCNGTKRLVWENNHHKIKHEADMMAEIGPVAYKKIMKWLFNHQAEISLLYPNVNFTGTFFQYRGSLLNWCPIGRIANDTLRYGWTCQDNEWKIRKTYMEELQKYLKAEKIPVTVALGGSTSFDIYPDGWDKTYGLKHYPDKQIFFIGDRCEQGGNDWHIFNALNTSGNAWRTDSPKDTIGIINRLIGKLRS